MAPGRMSKKLERGTLDVNKEENEQHFACARVCVGGLFYYILKPIPELPFQKRGGKKIKIGPAFLGATGH